MVKVLNKTTKKKSKKTATKIIGKAKMRKSIKHAAKRKAVMKKRTIVKKMGKKVTKKLIKKVTLRSRSQPSPSGYGGQAGQGTKKSPAMAGSIGKVVHYYDKIGVAILELTAPLTVGELVTFKRGEREFTQPVSSMQINHASVEKAKKGDVIGVKVVQVADNGTLALRA